MARSGKVLSLDNVAAPCSLSVPDGPTLHGFLSTHGVVNYLNIPYARLSARFQTARLLPLADLNGEVNATQYGPRCPQGIDSVHILMNHLFEKLPMEQYADEFSCLTVNVYAPPDVGHNNRLPVFAWIHGGAFRSGCNTVEWDGNHLVARAMHLGRPIVVVSINYRLGVLGFLTSRELDAEASHQAATPIRNQGLQDQKTALQWIQQHIHLFGGKPSNVTVGGESAGAMSIHYLLKCRTEMPLFQRALVCSSPDVGHALRPPRDGQAQFDAIVASAGISSTAPYQVKLAALRSYNAHELIALLPEDMAAVMPMPFPDRSWFVDYDGDGPDAIPPHDYWAVLPEWCHELVVGCTKDEMALFIAREETVSWTREQAQQKLAVTVGPNPGLVEAIWDTPALSPSPTTTPFGRVVAFGTNLFIRGPTLDFAAAARRLSPDHRVFLYSIDIVDPFPGTAADGSSLEGTGRNGILHGFAWHSFGNALVFYQPACQKDKELGATTDKMTEAHIRIMHGETTSWQPFGVAGRKMIWNGSQSGMVDVGFGPYDPVADYLQTLGNEAHIHAYAAFRADPGRLQLLME